MRNIIFLCLVCIYSNSTISQNLFERNEDRNAWSLDYYNASAIGDSINDSIINAPGISVFFELAGKGYFSVNVGFKIKEKHRLSFGLTYLDYDTKDESAPDSVKYNTWMSPGIMYYYLFGTGPSYLELGAGLSISPRLNVDFYSDHPLSLHGVIGYRYQKKNGFFFRAGFTPFYRVNVWFLPLLGVSFGYSW